MSVWGSFKNKSVEETVNLVEIVVCMATLAIWMLD